MNFDLDDLDYNAWKKSIQGNGNLIREIIPKGIVRRNDIVKKAFIDCLLEMAHLKLLMKKKDEAKSYYEKAKKLSVNIADEKLDDM